MNDKLRDLKNKSTELKIKNNLIDKTRPLDKTNSLSSGLQFLSIAIELVASVIVGLIIGIFLDKMLDNKKPIALVICLILSCLAGLRRLWLIIQN